MSIVKIKKINKTGPVSDSELENISGGQLSPHEAVGYMPCEGVVSAYQAKVVGPHPCGNPAQALVGTGKCCPVPTKAGRLIGYCMQHKCPVYNNPKDKKLHKDCTIIHGSGR